MYKLEIEIFKTDFGVKASRYIKEIPSSTFDFLSLDVGDIWNDNSIGHKIRDEVEEFSYEYRELRDRVFMGILEKELGIGWKDVDTIEWMSYSPNSIQVGVMLE